jgi:uncharacterized membrane protein
MAENLASTSESKDVEDNKIYAILAYFGILFIVPLLVAKESRFARYHTNQGFILFIATIIGSTAAWIVTTILILISGKLISVLILIIYLFILAVFIMAIIGIINAAQGKEKELPFIGKFQILK